jgi:hypothetical protein
MRRGERPCSGAGLGSGRDQRRPGRIAAPTLPVILTATWSRVAVALSARVAHVPTSAQLLFALAENGLSSTVTAGENRGLRLRHEHIVRSFAVVGIDAGVAVARLATRQDLIVPNCRRIACVCSDTGTIIGARPCRRQNPHARRGWQPRVAVADQRTFLARRSGCETSAPDLSRIIINRSLRPGHGH